jgi:hypothetical protein
MKTFTSVLSTLLLVSAALIFSACNTDSVGPDGSSVRTTISGRVLDEADKPVSGATVSGHGGTTTTDANGFFILKDLSVPSDRCFVICTKSGFLKGIRAASPRSNGSTPMEIVLLKSLVVTTVNSSFPKIVTLDNGGTVVLPPDGFQLMDGTSYNGSVEVVARRLDPGLTEFGRIFPGDILGKRIDGSEVSLLSYGVIIVELQSTSGQPLQLISGKTAKLTFPIPASMRSSAPATIPLWYLDESIGKWKEEGSATKSGDFYIGDVAHFTPWNCDDPLATPCFLHLRVLTRRGKPAGGVRVRVGQIIFITDANGDVRGYGTQQTTAQVPPELNFGIGSEVIDVSCVAGQAVDRTLIIDGATVSGLVINCEGKPIASLVYATWGTGQTNYVASAPGPFNMLVPANEQIVVHALGGSSKIIGPLASGDSLDVGTLVVCTGGGIGQPKAGTTFVLHWTTIDENGNPTSEIDTMLNGVTLAVDTTILGKEHVTISNLALIAHESNGDISIIFQDHSWRSVPAMRLWFPGKWIGLPIVSQIPRTLPTHDSILGPSFTEQANGSITYEGEELLTIAGKQHTAQRVNFLSIVQTFLNGRPQNRNVVSETHWYVQEIDLLAKIERVEMSGDSVQNTRFFGGDRYTVVSYSLK